jgi:hypothetical protein
LRNSRRGRAARLWTVAIIGLALAAFLGSSAGGAQAGPPAYETNFAADVTHPRPCAYDVHDPYERNMYRNEGWKGPRYVRYPGACERLRFAYGPIELKPGQNDALVGPITIEKPSRDGYVTRFKENLVKADGSVAPVEQVHLHHGTWLSVPSYGNGPIYAAGEEKTVAPYPRGYGLPIKATDQWQLLYMVHSAVAQPMTVYITYELDFIPKAKGDAIGLKPAYPLWLDVRPQAYPVFNVQRKYGGSDGECTWPKEQCSDFDPWGKKVVGQGLAGNGKGRDLALPKGRPFGAIKHFTGGTIIGMGGHIHPGGLRNEVDVVRPGGEMVTRHVHGRTVRKRIYQTRIYTGRPHYWNRRDTSHDTGREVWRNHNGPPTSWDFTEEVAEAPHWSVHVKPGDILRSNVTYDTRHVSSYEDMGISIGLLAPDTPGGKPTAVGVDPFKAKRDNSKDCRSGGPKNGYLCTVGMLSHGEYKENSNYGGPQGHWTLSTGGPTNNVGIADFQYLPGDLSSGRPIPSVKLGTKLRFTNLEAAGIYHTVTSCDFPCLGKTGAAFPLSDGRTSTGRKVDIDSTELGVGPPAVGAATNTISWELPVTASTGFKPGEKVTYFCRIHPFMRGAFEVSK